jgi:hypothetical protein
MCLKRERSNARYALQPAIIQIATIATNCTRLAATQRGHLQRDISELDLIDQTNAMANQLADALYELICPHDYQMRYSEVPEKENSKFRN